MSDNLSKGQVFWGRVAQLVRRVAENATPPAARPVVTFKPVSESSGVEVFARRLKKLLADQGQVMAGSIHFINLDQVRERLEKAGKWASHGERIENHCSRVIRDRLEKTDMFLSLPGPTFVIIFSHLQAEAARLKCGMIGEEIEHQLFGSHLEFRDVRVRVSVALLDQEDMTFDDIDVRAEAQKILQRTVECTDSEDKAFDNPWIISPPDGGAANCERNTEWYYEQYPERPPQMSFLYLPMWHVRNGAIGTFLCMPAVPVTSTMMLIGDAIYAAAPASLVCELDCDTLAKVKGDLKRMLEGGRRSMLCMPVHFETMARSTGRRKFLELCAELSEGERRHLIIELVDLPEGAPHARLSELLSILRPFARVLNVRSHLTCPRFDILSAANVFAVGVALGRERLCEAEMLPMLSAFTLAAEQSGLRTYGIELCSRSMVAAAMGAGFHYLSGGAIGSAIDAPEAAYRFQTADLYAELIQ